MVRSTIRNKKTLLIFLLFFFFYLFYAKNSEAQTKVAFGTFLVTAEIINKCDTTASEPVFVDDDFLSIKLVSDVTVVCNSDTKPIIKIISKNIKELFDNNFALQFKKNNRELIGFIPDSLVRLAPNSLTRIDYEDETLIFKNQLSEKIIKSNFNLPKLLVSKNESAKYLKYKNSTIIFEISY